MGMHGGLYRVQAPICQFWMAGLICPACHMIAGAEHVGEHEPQLSSCRTTVVLCGSHHDWRKTESCTRFFNPTTRIETKPHVHSHANASLLVTHILIRRLSDVPTKVPQPPSNSSSEIRILPYGYRPSYRRLKLALGRV